MIITDEELNNLIVIGLMDKYDNNIDVVNQKFKELKQRLVK